MTDLRGLLCERRRIDFLKCARRYNTYVYILYNPYCFSSTRVLFEILQSRKCARVFFFSFFIIIIFLLCFSCPYHPCSVSRSTDIRTLFKNDFGIFPSVSNLWQIRPRNTAALRTRLKNPTTDSVLDNIIIQERNRS